MRIITSKVTPSAYELIGILQREFSYHYAYKLFGLGSEKSIIVSKSTFIGVQISKRGNEITIEGIPPTTNSWILLFLDSLITGMMGGAVRHLLFGSSWKKLEKEIALFLKQKYH